MKKILSIVTIICCYSCKNQNKESTGITAAPSDTISVQTKKAIHPIRPFFWGTNLLFWVDDDSTLANNAVANGLKEIHTKLLRYPGGTVADNFHWRTNTLDNINMFPFQDGAAETDFDEFMQLCQKIGAEPSVVVNTESWVIKDNVQAGAHEAATWLRYCKENNYNVKYWEIGNETYWHPVMSAREYAAVVNVYADSLKKIDPNIIIGVNGHWDINMVGTKERIKPEAYEQVMAYRKNINSREDFKRYKKFVDDNKKTPITKGDIKWWQTVAEGCGSNIDMLVVHWYFGRNQLKIMSKKLLEVRNLLSEMYPEKSFLLNISEYNTIKTKYFKNDEHLYLTEAIGAMLRAGTDISAFWPMRMKRIGKSRLLDYETPKPSIIAKIHQHLAETLKGNLVQTIASGDVSAYATYAENSAAVVLTGRLIKKPATVKIKITGDEFSSCNIWRITGNEYNYRIKEEKLTPGKDGEMPVIRISPLEVVVVDYNR